VEGGLLLNVVIRKSASVLELLASEDQTLLVGGDSLLVLDLGLHGVDGVRALDLEGDGLASEGLHEDLKQTLSVMYKLRSEVQIEQALIKRK
jgi:hypothetical protein